MSNNPSNLSAQLGQTTVNQQTKSSIQANSTTELSDGNAIFNQWLQEQTWAAVGVLSSESGQLETAGVTDIELAIGENRFEQAETVVVSEDALAAYFYPKSSVEAQPNTIERPSVESSVLFIDDGYGQPGGYSEAEDILFSDDLPIVSADTGINQALAARQPVAMNQLSTAVKAAILLEHAQIGAQFAQAGWVIEEDNAVAELLEPTMPVIEKEEGDEEAGKAIEPVNNVPSVPANEDKPTVSGGEDKSSNSRDEDKPSVSGGEDKPSVVSDADKSSDSSGNDKPSVVSDVDKPSDSSDDDKSSVVSDADKPSDSGDDNKQPVSANSNASSAEIDQLPEAGPAAEQGRAGRFGNYRVNYSKQYGDYIKVTDFGADPTGKKDSYAAIQKALAAAHKEKAMLYMEGTFYVSDQIVINAETSGVKGIFGAGMGKTVIQFNKKQTGVFNSDTNHDDIREYAGILVDGQNNKKIAGLSVEYTGGDYYRKGLSYFGKVTGILVNDSDNTLIDSVEVSGVNRSGIFFTSTDALTREAGQNLTYKQRVADGKIDEHYAALPLGENNRVINSYLHDNRVSGLMVAYQENFTASGNTLSYNGHRLDGGTGYGASVMAGSYNYGIKFTKNTTDHNYRKGLDVHDGTDIVITDNTLKGDRLYGIAVYNRQFGMDNVVISGNTIIQDPKNRLANDDDLGAYYRLYSAIQLQTNTQFRDWKSSSKGYFEISNNTIENLTLYGESIQQYGIEFRNHESKMDYTLNISGNDISGASTKYLIAVINDTKNQVTGKNGLGSGTISISGNSADIGTIAAGAVPVYIEERNANGVVQRGAVIVDNNDITVRDKSDGYAEFLFMRSNAAKYSVTNNNLDLGGRLNDGIIEVRDIGRKAADVEMSVVQNTIATDIKGPIYKTWLRATEAQVYAEANTHNGEKLDTINNTGHKISLSDVLSDVNQSLTTINQTAYDVKQTTKIEDNIVNVGVL